jgi:hypothetical protein
MKCPHCGNFIENILFKALDPYRDSKIVITNLDYILEVGPRIRALIEEKNSDHKVIRGYQLITLRKVARSLNVPLYLLFNTSKGVELYEYPHTRRVRSSPFVNFESWNPVFAGSVEGLGSFFYEKFLVYAPPKERRKRKEVIP